MKQITFKLPTIKEVNFKVEALEEDIQVRVNTIASGDEEEDKKVEDRIIRRLNNGNQWAWCTAKVTATYKGKEGTAYLGCCSYKDKDDFMTDGYYKDMKEEAYQELISELESLQD